MVRADKRKQVTRERKKKGLQDKDFGEKVQDFIGGLLEKGPDMSTNSTTTTTLTPTSEGSILWPFDLLGIF